MLVGKFDPFPVRLDDLHGRRLSRALAKIVGEQQIKGVAKPATNQERHGVRVRAKLEDPANVVRSKIFELPQHDLYPLHAVADVPFLPRTVAKHPADALEERAIAVWITDESCHYRERCWAILVESASPRRAALARARPGNV